MFGSNCAKTGSFGYPELQKRHKEKMKQEINRHEIMEKITPLIENTAMRFGLIPIEIDFEKENHRWFLRIFLFAQDRGVTLEDCENVYP